MQNHNNIHGLSDAQVLELREQFGYNEVIEEEVSLFIRLLKKMYAPISIMMEVALALSVITGKWEDGIVIAVLLGINITVDMVQEAKAHTALASIKKTLAPTALALRNDEFVSIPTRELVPGDILKLSAGDIVPADATVLDDAIFSIDQSSVTGESLPIEKKIDEELFASTIVQNGSGHVCVTATGAAAKIGKSIELVNQADLETSSDFERAIFGMSRFLIVLSLVLAAVVFVSLTIRGDSFTETLRFALVLVVAAIPVALPTVLSVTLALGARKLAKDNAVVSNARAIEALAGVDQLCVDKTGTLTRNQLSIEEPITYGQYDVRTLFAYALLASDEGFKSSIEKAIYAYAKENDLLNASEAYIVEKFIPFDPRTKITAAHAKDGAGTVFLIDMGAPQIIAKKVTDTQMQEALLHDVEEEAHRGFKTLAVSMTQGETTYAVGLLKLIDPPRDGARTLIHDIIRKGVSIKMLTGDSLPIATYIAEKLNIGNRVINRDTLDAVEKTTEDETDDLQLICDTDVFAEVTPEDKYHVVETLQHSGHLVAMTGDGVNDAPALKMANVGFAVSGATDAARSAADVVLFDSSLSVIDTAITHARVIFARMQSYATFRIAETIRIIFFISIAVFAFNVTPVSAIMIILLALINDIPVMAIAYDNAEESTTPVRWHLRETIIVAAVLGLAGLVSSLLLFSWFIGSGYSLLVIQTAMFLKLDVSGHSTLYLTRAGKGYFWKRPYPSLAFFLPAFGSRIFGTLIVIFGVFMTAIPLSMVAGIWVYALVWFVINDNIKVGVYRVLDALSNRRKAALLRLSPNGSI